MVTVANETVMKVKVWTAEEIGEPEMVDVVAKADGLEGVVDVTARADELEGVVDVMARADELEEVPDIVVTKVLEPDNDAAPASANRIPARILVSLETLVV